MNKILYLLISLVVFTSCANSYHVQGSSNVTDLDGRMLYLKVLQDNDFKNIDSSEVVHGQFQFAGTLDSARMANIFMDDRSVLTFVLEEGDINIKINNTQQTVSGTPLNDKLFKFFNEYNQLKSQQAELVHRHDQAIMNGSNMDVVNAQLNAEAESLSQPKSPWPPKASHRRYRKEVWHSKQESEHRFPECRSRSRSPHRSSQ